MSHFPFKIIPNNKAADGEVDNDGLVGIHSGLGVQLSSNEYDYFDHSKNWNIDNKQIQGSWYRLYDGPWNFQNHASIIKHSKTGKWVRKNIINKAGPNTGTSEKSTWNINHEFFDSKSPKVIVLLHGATNKPDFEPEKQVNQLNHVGDYWGWDFIYSLLGGQNSTLHTISNKTLTGNKWNAADFASIFGSTPEPDDHFLVSEPFKGSIPPVSLMVTYRDGSEKLATQTKRAIEQIHKLYTQKFDDPDKQPQIIFVAHSMGGLVARHLLTNPTETLNKVKLSKKERDKATFIREKTLYLLTISTPHEGSILADKTVEFGDLFDFVPEWYEGLKNKINFNPLQYTMDFLGSDRDSTFDLRVSSWKKWNKDILSPEKMKRKDNSLIPLYCLSGRSPGGNYFDNPNELLGGIQPSINQTQIQEQKEAFGLVLFDWALHNVPHGATSWGAPPLGSRDLDWIKKTTLNDIAPLQATVLKTFFKVINPSLAGTLSDIFINHIPYYLDHSWRTLSAKEAIIVLHRSYRYTTSQILRFIRDTYASNMNDAVRILKETGLFSTRNMARAITKVFNASAIQVAELMKDIWHKNLMDTARLLKDLGFSAKDIVKTLKSVHNATAIEISEFLKDTWNKGLMDTVKLLISVRFNSYDISRAIKKIYNASAIDVMSILKERLGKNLIDAAKRLRKAGFTSYDIAIAMNNVFNAPAISVANFLKSSLRKNLDSTAKILIAAGYSAKESTKAMKAVFHASAIQIATLLKDIWHKNVLDAAKLLKAAGFSSWDIFKAMKRVFNASAITIARFSKEVLHLNEEEAAKRLKHAGFSSYEIAIMMKEVFNSSVYTVAQFIKDSFGKNYYDTARRLKSAGFSSTQVAKALKRVFNVSAISIARLMRDIWHKNVKDTAKLLKAAGFSSRDTAKAMKKIFHASAKTIAKILKSEWGKSANQTAKILKSIGFSIHDTAKVMKDVFHSSISTIYKFIATEWGEGWSVIKSILINIGFTWRDLLKL